MTLYTCLSSHINTSCSSFKHCGKVTTYDDIHLGQVMGHYLKQCWRFMKGVLYHLPECTFTRSTHEYNLYVTCVRGLHSKITTTISPRGQWVIHHSEIIYTMYGHTHIYIYIYDCASQNEDITALWPRLQYDVKELHHHLLRARVCCPMSGKPLLTYNILIKFFKTFPEHDC